MAFEQMKAISTYGRRSSRYTPLGLNCFLRENSYNNENKKNNNKKNNDSNNNENKKNNNNLHCVNLVCY
jgi:hypothetical protein